MVDRQGKSTECVSACKNYRQPAMQQSDKQIKFSKPCNIAVIIVPTSLKWYVQLKIALICIYKGIQLFGQCLEDCSIRHARYFDKIPLLSLIHTCASDLTSALSSAICRLHCLLAVRQTLKTFTDIRITQQVLSSHASRERSCQDNLPQMCT